MKEILMKAHEVGWVYLLPWAFAWGLCFGIALPGIAACVFTFLFGGRRSQN
jgi:hypothetical protein